jgi:uncharacterized BrkB/YihY/UPF0761 family membrane protein
VTGNPDPERRGDDASLADTIRELANQPVGSGRLARRRRHLLELAERLTTVGPLARPAEIGWSASRRIQRAGGSALPALLAYRVFVWLLPLALVAVFVVGLYREEPIDPQRAIDRFGVPGYVAASIAQATEETGGPGLLSGAIVGSLVLLYMTYALVRGLRAVHALIWGVRLTRLPHPLPTTILVLASLLAMVLGRGLLDGLGGRVGWLLEALLVLASDLVVPALWLGVSLLLPHRARSWHELLPGAILFGITLALTHVLVALLLFPYLEQKKETYGGLGLAAGIMLALYGIGWAVTAAAALNAELADQRQTAGTGDST